MIYNNGSLYFEHNHKPNGLYHMESKSERKISITKKILDVNDDSVLDEIEHLLEETETVAVTSDGQPLTRAQYKHHLEKISSDIQSGATTYSSDDIREYVLNQNR
jgi:hypothetical protein